MWHSEIQWIFLRLSDFSLVDDNIVNQWEIRQCQEDSTGASPLPSPSNNLDILTKDQPLYKTWASKFWPNQASEARPRFNLDSTFYKTSAEKKLSKLQLQILPPIQLQNLEHTLCSKSVQKFSFLTKPQLRNLQQIVANTILISNSYNINKFGVGIFTRQGDINQVY